MNSVKKSIFMFLVAVSAWLSCASVGRCEDNTGHISGAIFEKHGGYVHGYLSVAEKYSDNIFYESTNEKNDLITIVSPGIWLSAPGSQDKIPETDTTSVTPGGIVSSSLSTSEPRRLRASLIYSPEFEIYSENSDEDTSRHRLEGSLQYRFGGGLTLGAMDQYHSSHDNRGYGFNQLLNKYNTNLIQAFAKYDLSGKITLRADVANYDVDYTDTWNDDWDRTDDRVSGTLFYHMTSKTSFFTEYELITIGYDKNTINDSEETSILGGLQWDVTDKSTGLLKFGWYDRSYNQSGYEDEASYRLEFQVNHWFTSKTRVTMLAYRRATETNYFSSAYLVTNYASIGYRQRLRSKLQLNLDASYWTDNYETENFADFNEDYYRGSAGISYAFRQWLTAGCEYTYGHRNSGYSDIYGYTTNEILFRVTASL